MKDPIWSPGHFPRQLDHHQVGHHSSLSAHLRYFPISRHLLPALGLCHRLAYRRLGPLDGAVSSDHLQLEPSAAGHLHGQRGLGPGKRHHERDRGCPHTSHADPYHLASARTGR